MDQYRAALRHFRR